MANPNLLALTTITGKTAVLAVTTTPTAIITAAASTLVKVNTLAISNIDGTNPASITVDVYRGTTASKIASTVAVGINSTLVLLEKSTFIYLEEGDVLRLTASADGDLYAVVSYDVMG